MLYVNIMCHAILSDYEVYRRVSTVQVKRNVSFASWLHGDSEFKHF